jgi:hypothetical protein
VSTHLDPATVEILCAVQAAAMRELLNGVDEPAKEALARAKVARALFDAAVSGERDPERLKAAAIKGAARLLRHSIDSSPGDHPVAFQA